MDAELDPSDLAQAVADAGGAVAKIAEQLAVVIYAYGVDTIDACAHLTDDDVMEAVADAKEKKVEGVNAITRINAKKVVRGVQRIEEVRGSSHKCKQNRDCTAAAQDQEWNPSAGPF